MFDQQSLAVIFVSLMALSTLLYVILDGYDLGVGMLLPIEKKEHADTMIASIGPFWDANETWLVFAVGLLLIAFPAAYNLILKALYLPSVVMLIGLILRGVAFDFRAKAAVSHRKTWDKTFKAGSFIAALSQGYILGIYVTGFEQSWMATCFAIMSAFGVACAYMLIGAGWLVMKTHGELQQTAIKYAQRCVVITFIGVVLVSGLNLWVNPEVYEKWFTWPYGLFLLPIPMVCCIAFFLCFNVLRHLKKTPEHGSGLPFFITVFIFTLSFFGLSFSFFPDIVPNQLTIWQSVAAPESLNFILWGAFIVVPTILAYTVYSYRVFWGKADELNYY
ncbi:MULTISPECIES: cytochrome d ubiquinol oxidase subunit II [Thalassotalea]|uniref:cytochrome d ubiquinol oxidase subunit II n=1 Tax=Thalassotalea TaxID=1518149 RepID=UPI0009438D74|nr:MULTISPECIES: cytochrome d ubiquinol oxidase subunit II [Thalassotalea]OKY25148.1 cytochrome d ubiquinol oxidase subunit II [Thalassotalea sp. PP2-459]